MPTPRLTRRHILAAAFVPLPTDPRVILATPFGAIHITLFARQAPLSAADFLRYVDAGAYNGGHLFRVVRPGNDHGNPPIAVVQGGIKFPKLAGPPIRHEPTGLTGLRHRNGTISLTRDAPGTGSGAEFFICVGDQPGLDEGGHRNKDGEGFAAFGTVTQGMEAVRQIWMLPADGPSTDTYTRGQILTDPVTFTAARG
jgi:peptidyl-prolyl cis-trans isomerase A (cyclophilin A)